MLILSKIEAQHFQTGFQAQEKRRRPRREEEHREQCAVVAWARAMTHQEPRLALFYAIPNVGGRSKAQEGKLKAEGRLKGMPDLCLPVSSPLAVSSDHCPREHALYIEMKSAKGALSAEQKKVIAGLRGHGNRVEICRSADEAITAIKDYLGMEE
jgi:hypothetical protein